MPGRLSTLPPVPPPCFTWLSKGKGQLLERNVHGRHVQAIRKGPPPGGRGPGPGRVGRDRGQESRARCSHPRPGLLGLRAVGAAGIQLTGASHLSPLTYLGAKLGLLPVRGLP